MKRKVKNCGSALVKKIMKKCKMENILLVCP